MDTPKSIINVTNDIANLITLLVLNFVRANCYAKWCRGTKCASFRAKSVAEIQGVQQLKGKSILKKVFLYFSHQIDHLKTRRFTKGRLLNF